MLFFYASAFNIKKHDILISFIAFFYVKQSNKKVLFCLIVLHNWKYFSSFGLDFCICFKVFKKFQYWNFMEHLYSIYFFLPLSVSNRFKIKWFCIHIMCIFLMYHVIWNLKLNFLGVQLNHGIRITSGSHMFL